MPDINSLFIVTLNLLWDLIQLVYEKFLSVPFTCITLPWYLLPDVTISVTISIYSWASHLHSCYLNWKCQALWKLSFTRYIVKRTAFTVLSFFFLTCCWVEMILSTEYSLQQEIFAIYESFLINLNCGCCRTQLYSWVQMCLCHFSFLTDS